MTKPRMLVTGGSGFLGRWVVCLARTDWDVTATYLNNPVVGPYAHWRSLDVRNRPAVTSLMEETIPRVVVHTAALNPGQGSAFSAVNEQGTQNVAEAAALIGARLVHVSTDVVFDGKQGSYVEQDLPAPITAYGRSKALAEIAVHRSGARAIIVRTSLIYGPSALPPAPGPKGVSWREWDRQTHWVVGDLRAGRPVRLFTDERRCPIWVASLASALVEVAALDLAQERGPQVLHVAGADAVSRYQFGVRLALFHGVDPAGISPVLSETSGLNRPLDCSLDCSRANSILRTPLPGVNEVLSCAGAPPGAKS